MGGSIYIDNITIEGDTSTGKEEVARQEALAVYPNPASSSVQIFIDHEDIQQLQIFDVAGKVVFEKNLSSGTTSSHTEQVDLSDFQKGIYFIVATTAKQERVVRKLVVGE